MADTANGYREIGSSQSYWKTTFSGFYPKAGERLVIEISTMKINISKVIPLVYHGNYISENRYDWIESPYSIMLSSAGELCILGNFPTGSDKDMYRIDVFHIAS